ncbi:site-2 protease family protein [Paenibacillus sediminis]|uniref:Zn-dependent protease n=1 Tax=Paenibacillus sediminis TaxID=664909 RepID=A0ABS4GZ22_9BACL|nr:site-2 protease family protein [Paenibacillus sediminis]MBP1935382.1 Zn-dependent protease [Paenibacillus sediminis]
MDFLQPFLAWNVKELPFVLLALLIGFTFHEFAHAYFANKFGDPTAKLLGRVTLNPASHIDLFGTLLLIIAGFGWARPVPVNRDNFSKPRLMGIIVSAAGPLSNLFIAAIGAMIISLLKLGTLQAIPNDNVALAIYIAFHYIIQINILLFIFNLIPLPPLDGYRILEDIVPRAVRIRLQQLEQWSFFIFILVVFISPIRRVTIDPLFSQVDRIYWSLIGFFGQLFGVPTGM